jgi:serine O-acetyltransferase
MTFQSSFLKGEYEPGLFLMKRDVYYRLIYARTYPVIGGFAYYILKLLGAEIPRPVKIGADFELAHGGFGVVIHPNTRIGKRVKIYPGVTLGRADIFRPVTQSRFEGIVVEDGHLCPGARYYARRRFTRSRG